MKKLTKGKLIVANSRESADLLYATGFKVPDPMVFLIAGRRRFAVVPEMELGRARAECRCRHVFTPEALGLRRKAGRQLSSWAAAVLRLAGIRRVSVPGAFPLGIARKLERQGFRLDVAPGAFFPERVVKSTEEIRKLRFVQQATVEAMRLAFALIADAHAGRDQVLRLGGAVLSAERVRQALNKHLLDADCAGGEPIVACGPDAADPHNVGHGPLRAGQTIAIDIFPQHLGTGYWGDLTRTVVKGRPDAAVLKMYRAVRAVQQLALDMIRPGANAGRIHSAVEREFERRGFPRGTIDNQPAGFIHGTGHGVGLEIHEAPFLGRTNQPLRAGHVVTVEPGLYHPGLGGVRIEDTVVVTSTGFLYLARCPKALIIP
jgi:Xaa-Pro aminopeptidase